MSLETEANNLGAILDCEVQTVFRTVSLIDSEAVHNTTHNGIDHNFNYIQQIKTDVKTLFYFLCYSCDFPVCLFKHCP